MADIEIRHVRDGDADAVHQMLEAGHVVRGAMRLPSLSREAVKERIRPADGVVKLVAVRNGSVAGYGELITRPDLQRRRHAGEISMIATHPDHKNRKVGQQLMKAMVDMAGSWVQLSQLALIAWTSNPSAITLAQDSSFPIQGAMPQFAFIEGRFAMRP